MIETASLYSIKKNILSMLETLEHYLPNICKQFEEILTISKLIYKYKSDAM